MSSIHHFPCIRKNNLNNCCLKPFFFQLAEDEEQYHQLLMIQEMIDDGESIEEIRVSNITSFVST